MPDTEPNNLQTILTFAGGILAVTLPLVVSHLLKKGKEHPVEDSDFEVKFTLEELVEINDEVAKLLKSTRLDRFVILKAENGRTSPKYATAIYEQHRHQPVVVATTAYRKVKIDNYYRDMLVQAEDGEMFKMHTPTMPQSRLKSIYLSEGVTHSHCYFICRYPLASDKEKWIILYCTLATKDDVPFTDNEVNSFGLFADWLRSLFTHEIEEAQEK